MLAIDPTSSQTAEQLPTYNAYSLDGDVTAPLVYVNYGVPEDYEQLDRMGISVKGAIVIARYGGPGAASSRKSRPSTAPSAASSIPTRKDDGYFQGDVYPDGPIAAARWRAARQRDGYAVYPGDPLTPGYRRDRRTRSGSASRKRRRITKIPVLPISYGDAQPLLAALAGPVAPEAWRGALADHLSHRPGAGDGSPRS